MARSPKTNSVKRHFSYTINDAFKLYMKENGKVIDKKTYRIILEGFFELIAKKVIYENRVFQLPYSLGCFFIKKWKNSHRKKNPPIDKITSKKLKRRVLHMNMHTYNFLFGLKWNKEGVSFTNRAFYVFDHTRSSYAAKNGVGKIGMSKHIFEQSKGEGRVPYTGV